MGAAPRQKYASGWVTTNESGRKKFTQTYIRSPLRNFTESKNPKFGLIFDTVAFEALWFRTNQLRPIGTSEVSKNYCRIAIAKPYQGCSPKKDKDF